MKQNAERLFALVQSGLNRDILEKAATLLLGSEARVLEESPSHGTVIGLLPTLRARQLNAGLSGVVIHGLATAIVHLEQMAPEAPLLGYSVISTHAAGAVYVDEATGKCIGVTITLRR
jgi:hypothetical protein